MAYDLGKAPGRRNQYRNGQSVRVHRPDPHEVVAARPPGVGVLEAPPHIVREGFERRVALALASTFDGVEVAAVLAAYACHASDAVAGTRALVAVRRWRPR